MPSEINRSGAGALCRRSLTDSPGAVGVDTETKFRAATERTLPLNCCGQKSTHIRMRRWPLLDKANKYIEYEEEGSGVSKGKVRNVNEE